MASNLFSDSPDHVSLQTNSKRANISEQLSCGPKTGRSQLGVDFQPSNHSVICGRGKDSYNHTGNRYFRILASVFVERYSRVDSKADKSALVFNILTIIREAGGQFCKYEKGEWFEVGDRCASGKVSSLLRDMLHNRYGAPSKVKIARRKARSKENERQTQQSDQQLVNDTDHCDDSSMASCSGTSTDSLGFDSSLEIEFFDIDVF
jgi:hypothetical protein